MSNPKSSFLVRALWDSYERAVVPKEAGLEQRTECRRAFYAGAGAVFAAIASIIVDPTTEEVTVGDLLAMERIHEELDQFARDVQAGKA